MMHRGPQEGPEDILSAESNPKDKASLRVVVLLLGSVLARRTFMLMAMVMALRRYTRKVIGQASRRPRRAEDADRHTSVGMAVEWQGEQGGAGTSSEQHSPSLPLPGSLPTPPLL
jgi:hypothetical protein